MSRSTDQPLISIITVVFNGVASLEATMLSIFNQTYTDFEYIVIDGGSQDGTLDIIRKYESKIAVWKSERDNGIYDAMNKGLNFAKGRWILFLNSGDTIYDSKTLENVVGQIRQDAISDLIFGDVSIVYPNGEKVVRKLKMSPLFLLRNMVCHQCILYARSVFDRVGRFNTTYKLIADFDHLVKVRWGGLTIRKIPEIIASYTMDGVSAQKENIEKIWNERVRIFRRKPRNMNTLLYIIYCCYARAARAFRNFF